MCYYFRGVPLEGLPIMHNGYKEGHTVVMCSEITPAGARHAELPTRNACACGCQLHPKGRGFSQDLPNLCPVVRVSQGHV